MKAWQKKTYILDFLSFTALVSMPFSAIIADKSTTLFFFLSLLFIFLACLLSGDRPFLAVKDYAFSKSGLAFSGITVLLLLGSAALSIFSSINPEHSLKAFMRILLMVFFAVSFFALAHSRAMTIRRSWLNGFVFWLFGACFLLLGETQTGFLSDLIGDDRILPYYNYAAMVLAVFVFAGLSLLEKSHPIIWFGLFVTVIVVLSGGENQSALLGFLCGCFCLILFRALPNSAPLLLPLLILSGILLSLTQGFWAEAIKGSTAISELPPSWLHRLYIWQGYTNAILQSPWFGYGLDSSELYFDAASSQQIAYTTPGAVVIHAHNAAMTVWFELGLPGLLAFLMLAIYAMRAIAKMQPVFQPYAFAALASGLSQILLSRHFLQMNMVAGFLGLAVLFFMLNASRKDQ